MKPYVTYVLAAAILAGAGFLILPNAWQAGRGLLDEELAIQYELSRKTQGDYIREVDAALEASDAELASSIVSVAVEHNIELPQDVLDRVAAAEAIQPALGSELWNGFVYGEAENWTGFSAAVASDFVVMGDLRDLYNQAVAYPDYDAVVVSLAAVGVVATGVTVATLGTAAPAKWGVSVFKAARKLGKLPKSLLDDLTAVARRSVNDKALADFAKHAGSWNWRGARDAAGLVVDGAPARKVSDAAASIGTIAKGHSPRAVADTLERSKNLDDLSKFQRIADKAGPKKYRGILKLAAPLAAVVSPILVAMSWISMAVVWILAAAYIGYRIVRLLYRVYRAGGRLISTVPKR